MPDKTSTSSHRSVTLLLPSDLRFERLAVDTAVSLARQLAFSREKVEVLRTVVGEACLNAIEHGNGLDPGSRVEISFILGQEQLTVLVCDNGPGFDLKQISAPCLEDKLAGRSKQRGWGLFLIQALVDEMSVTRSPDSGNLLTLVVRQ